jgi:hypothetical protein
MEAQGNRRADEAANETALQSEAPISISPRSYLPLALPQHFVFKKRNDAQIWELPKLPRENGFYLMVEKCSPNQ